MNQAAALLLGLAVGSFLNVCIRRLPQGGSVVRPASRCPACHTPIQPYDNIPVLSYLLLRGKCRACRAPISPIYPVVEMATALLLLGCYRKFGFTLEGAKWVVFSCLLLILIFTDLLERILPDPVNFTGLAIGIGISFFSGPNDGTARWLSNRLFDFPPPEFVLSLADSILGAAFASGFLWLPGVLWGRLIEKEALGLGDVKMMAMVGTFFGLKRALLTILLGTLLGSVLGLAFILVKRKGWRYELPLGTFLGVAALVVVFFGRPMLEWYRSFFPV